LSEVESIVHGSTLVTNAVIERRGPPTGMIMTKGFFDVIDIANEGRYDIYDLKAQFPDPIIPRNMRREIDERMHADGNEVKPLDRKELLAAVESLVSEHWIKALAVCFLHSYRNPAHEDEARKAIADAFPELYVSTSADIFPYMREYHRWNTTAINAFTQPMVDSYLANLEGGLKKNGFRGAFYVMTSSGGVVSTDAARRFPVRMLESGPAAGVLMSAYHGRALGLDQLLSFDMGGTTAKGSIIRDGIPRKIYELEVARVHDFKVGSGLPVKVPVVDMIEIGAGGGGIAEVDERGLIKVGPRSAGASPGPACYGRGGQHATLTDANLMLGYYDAGFFLGGAMKLDRSASEKVIDTNVGKPLNLELVRAAWGIHEIINEDVARAFRVHASEIGFDYRNCTIIAFGGSGPAHAMRVARKLRVPRVVFPVASGVMSAIGMLICPISFQIARSRSVLIRDLDAKSFAELFRPVEEEAKAFLIDAGQKASSIKLVRSLDMRYRGQGFEIEVQLPAANDSAALFGELRNLFDKAYEEIFSLSYVAEELEIVNWKVEAVGPEPKVGPSGIKLRDVHPEGKSRKGSRHAYFPEKNGFVECPVYDRYAMGPEDIVEGPAFIEEREATFVIGVGDRVTVDKLGNLVAELAAGEAQ
jgi:N-methylhydantoinase A